MTRPATPASAAISGQRATAAAINTAINTVSHTTLLIINTTVRGTAVLETNNAVCDTVLFAVLFGA